MTEQHTAPNGGSEIIRNMSIRPRLLNALTLALMMAIVPATLAAQDRQPPVVAGGGAPMAAEAPPAADGSIYGAWTLPVSSSIDEVIRPRTNWYACGDAGCLWCGFTWWGAMRCYFR